MQFRTLFVAFALTLAAGCSVAAEEPPVKPKCASDADCVQAQCCHATSCVAKSEAPPCEGIACTMDCRPGTLDCGNGKCECRAGACTANLER
jgi:hypothetical protein